MFMPQGAPKLVRKTTSDSKKLKTIAQLLGVDDPENLKSAKVELTYKDAGGGGGSGSGGGGKASAKKASGKKASAKGR